MGSNEGAPRGSQKREIRFSDADAGASLPSVPRDVAPPVGELATIHQWAAQAGHVAPPVPGGGYRHRGDRFRGFDYRILIVHMKAHATAERPYVEGQMMTRAQYDALVAEAQGVTCGTASPMRELVESMEAHAGGFRPRAGAVAAAETKET